MSGSREGVTPPELSTVPLALGVVLVNAVFFWIVVGLCDPIFRTNDDAMRMMIAGGHLTGEPVGEVPFVNLLFGRFVAWLAGTTSAFDAYSGSLLALHFISMCVLLFAFVRTAGLRMALAIHAFLLAGFELGFLIRIEFTLTAGVAVAAGCLAWRAYTNGVTRRERLGLLVIGCTLIVAGFLVRASSATMTLALALPILLRRPERPLLKALVVTVLVSVAVTGYDHLARSSMPGWARHQSFESVRGAIHGHPFLRYDEETSRVFDEVGWTRNDFEIFHRYFYVDEDTFSLAKLEAVRDGLSRLGGDESVALESTRWVVRENLLSLVGLVLLALILVVLVRPRRLAYVNATFLMMIALDLYLIVEWKLPDRVLLAQVVVVSILLIHVILRTPELRFRWSRTMTRVSCVLLAATCVIQIAKATKIAGHNRRLSSGFARVTERLRAPRFDDTTFVLFPNSFPTATSPAYRWPEHVAGLRLIPSGWTLRSPLHHATLERDGITDLARAIYEREDVAVITYRAMVPVFERFVEEHHGERIHTRTLVSLDHRTSVVKFERVFRVTQSFFARRS